MARISMKVKSCLGGSNGMLAAVSRQIVLALKSLVLLLDHRQ